VKRTRCIQIDVTKRANHIAATTCRVNGSSYFFFLVPSFRCVVRTERLYLYGIPDNPPYAPPRTHR
ncbi:MAG: hypothetical protein WBZ50_07470, partial [Nitrososphaeraceae archaeon]